MPACVARASEPESLRTTSAPGEDFPDDINVLSAVQAQGRKTRALVLLRMRAGNLSWWLKFLLTSMQPAGDALTIAFWRETFRAYQSPLADLLAIAPDSVAVQSRLLFG